MTQEEKEGKLSDFLCRNSAAVLARSRSHYLCIRKNLSAQRSITLHIKIQNGNSTIAAPSVEGRFSERTDKQPYRQNTFGFSLHEKHV